MKLKDFLYRLHRSESISKEETTEMQNTIAEIPYLSDLDLNQIHPESSYSDINLQLLATAQKEYISNLKDDYILYPTITNPSIDPAPVFDAQDPNIGSAIYDSNNIETASSEASVLEKNILSKIEIKQALYQVEESDFVRFLMNLPPCIVPLNKLEPELQSLENTIENKSTPPQDIHQETDELIKSSLDLNQGISSESLANLWAKQGRLDLAIQMFEKLAAEYPEKSATFAVKIEKLKTDNSL